MASVLGGVADLGADAGALAGGWGDFAAGLVWGGGAGAGAGVGADSLAAGAGADSEVGAGVTFWAVDATGEVGAFSAAASSAFGNPISFPQPSMGQAYWPASCVLICSS